MDKEKLLKTAVAYYSKEDECYIVSSPYDDIIVGDGDTPQEAYASYEIHVNANYDDYLKGKHGRYNAVGRPKRDKQRFNSEIKPTTLEEIKSVAQLFGWSQGDVIDVAIGIMQNNVTATPVHTQPQKVNVSAALPKATTVKAKTSSTSTKAKSAAKKTPATKNFKDLVNKKH